MFVRSFFHKSSNACGLGFSGSDPQRIGSKVSPVVEFVDSVDFAGLVAQIEIFSSQV